MDKIQVLKSRKEKILNAGKSVREQIAALVDEESFVELSAFSFSDKDFYGEDAEGEGVVTGFATIEDCPYYLVAQNFGVKKGGITKANCDKILKTLSLAEKNSVPVVYLLSSRGVAVGEGVTVLEGLASLLLRVTQLKGVVPQYAVVNGEVFGSLALLASACDFTFFLKDSVLCVNAPKVLSAKAGKNLSNEEVGGAKALEKAQCVTFECENFAEVKETIQKVNSLLAGEMIDAELNESAPALNEEVSAEKIEEILEGSVELGKAYCPETKTILTRIGGIPVACLLFAGEGVSLNADNMKKVKNFTELACCYSLPLVVFVNTVGVEVSMQANDSTVMKEIAEYLAMLDAMDTPKISVIYKKAVGLGYSLFAAKSMGFDYSIALSSAEVSLFESEQGAIVAFGKDDPALVERYSEEHADPVNAAKDGYLDDVIEPQFVKQYLIASLQMLLK